MTDHPKLSGEDMVSNGRPFASLGQPAGALRAEPLSGVSGKAAHQAQGCDPSRGPWLCFHCGDAFHDERSARLHFGPDEGSVAACVIKAGAEGSILRALREAERQAEEAWSILHSESSDFAKAWHSMRARHSQALIAAEELGYERGLADGMALPRNSEGIAQQEGVSK